MALSSQNDLHSAWSNQTGIDNFALSRDKGRDILKSLIDELDTKAKGQSAAIFPPSSYQGKKLNPRDAAFLRDHITKLLADEKKSPWTEGGKLIELAQSGDEQITILGIDDPKAIEFFLETFKKNESKIDQIPLADAGKTPVMSSVTAASFSLATLYTLLPDMSLSYSVGLALMAAIHPIHQSIKHHYNREGKSLRNVFADTASDSWTYAVVHSDVRNDFYKKLMGERITDQDIIEEEQHWASFLSSGQTDPHDVVEIEVNVLYRPTPTPQLVLATHTRNPPSSMNGRGSKPVEDPEPEAVFGLPGLVPVPIRER